MVNRDVSTHGAIVRITPDGFIGRYHHFDSYPAGLGKYLWITCHKYFGGNPEAMLNVLIDEHPGGWSTVINGNFSRDLINRESSYSPECYCHPYKSNWSNSNLESHRIPVWGDAPNGDRTPLTHFNITQDVSYVYAFDENKRMHIMTWKGNELFTFSLFDLSAIEVNWDEIQNRIWNLGIRAIAGE